MTSALDGARVLVTGGTGFIGSHLVRRLIELGCQVHATGRQLGRLAHLPVAVYEAPLEQPEMLRRLAVSVSPDVTFHLAARIERDRTASLLLPALRDNALPVAALCEALVSVRAARLVILGSGEDYGTASTPWTGDERELPVSPYGLSKVVAAQIVKTAHAAFGLAAAVARAPVVYGPGQGPGQFIPGVIAACLAGESFQMTPGEQLRDFLYVDDVVEGMIAMTAPEAAGKVINLATGHSTPIVDVARRIREHIGRGELQIGSLPYRPFEIMKQIMSPAAANELLGWKAQVPLAEGLRRTITAASAAAGVR